MTTIATDGETMAGDGMVASNGTIFGTNFIKVRQTKDGRIVGMCGSAYDMDPFIEWLEGGEEKPKLADEFEALVLSPDGTCRSYCNDYTSIIEELPTASGSGREIALGAMAVGATPEEAVKAACERSLGTGGKITVLSRPKRLRRVA